MNQSRWQKRFHLIIFLRTADLQGKSPPPAWSGIKPCHAQSSGWPGDVRNPGPLKRPSKRWWWKWRAFLWREKKQENVEKTWIWGNWSKNINQKRWMVWYRGNCTSVRRLHRFRTCLDMVKKIAQFKEKGHLLIYSAVILNRFLLDLLKLNIRCHKRWALQSCISCFQHGYSQCLGVLDFPGKNV